jgi:hypothetical protein
MVRKKGKKEMENGKKEMKNGKREIGRCNRSYSVQIETIYTKYATGNRGCCSSNSNFTIT